MKWEEKNFYQNTYSVSMDDLMEVWVETFHPFGTVLVIWDAAKYFELLKNSDQFFQGYENYSNIVSFFLTYNFIPDDFNTVSIPSNFFSLNIPQNNKVSIDEDYWHVKDGKFSNKKRIVFDNLKFPLEFKLEINKIIPNNSIVNKITISILEMLKNEIKHKELIKFTNEEADEDITRSFGEALKINYLKIEELINKLSINE